MNVERLCEQVSEWARSEPGVRAAFVVGSQARTDTPADEWSDVDVVLLADEPARLLDDTSWLSRFGTPLLSFVEETALGGERERRVLYDDGLEVDFAVFPASALAALAADPATGSVLARGHRILHDEAGLAAALAAAPPPAPPPPREPAEIAQDFWYHALWTAKKWRRGEALVARSCLESHLKPLLLEADRSRASGDTWHGSRFAERWASPEVVDATWSATARSPEELPAALERLCEAFAGQDSPSDTVPLGRVRARLEEVLGQWR